MEKNKKATYVCIKFDNGETQELSGNDAKAYIEEIHGLIGQLVHHNHDLKSHPWRITKASEIATPLPPPVDKGMAVSPALLEFIASKECNATAEEKKQVTELIQQRCKYGLEKYGQRLMSQDGRDDVVDALQEAGDLIQYAFKARLNERNKEMSWAVGPCLQVLVEVLGKDFSDYLLSRPLIKEEDRNHQMKEKNSDELEMAYTGFASAPFSYSQFLSYTQERILQSKDAAYASMRAPDQKKNHPEKTFDLD
jgi:hypothetical protein